MNKKIKLSLVAIIGCVVSAVASEPIILPKNAVGCAGCHGTDFSKSALNKSKKVSEMSEDEIKQSLIGYQKGTYGRDMKAVMTNNIKKLTESDIDNIAKSISGANKKVETEKIKMESIPAPENVETKTDASLSDVLSGKETIVLEPIVVTAEAINEEDESEIVVGDTITEVSECNGVVGKEEQVKCYEAVADKIPTKEVK